MQKIFLAAGAVIVLAVLIAPACDSSKPSTAVAVQTPAAQPPQDLAPKAPLPPDPVPAGPKVLQTLVLGDVKTGFATNAIWLTPDVRAKIDELVTKGKFDLNTVHFEIEGHTDNIGSKEANQRVGQARAEAVKRYLVFKHDVPEDCVTVISYGLDQPVADNSTEEGRAQNRRVVIKVVG